MPAVHSKIRLEMPPSVGRDVRREKCSIQDIRSGGAKQSKAPHPTSLDLLGGTSSTWLCLWMLLPARTGRGRTAFPPFHRENTEIKSLAVFVKAVLRLRESSLALQTRIQLLGIPWVVSRCCQE